MIRRKQSMEELIIRAASCLLSPQCCLNATEKIGNEDFTMQ